ncbi:MAG: hypothetical protein A4E61_01292 [Syntrophorhabdus sp. PtaB.Bin184]|nr:MAG: hypothetical protein A4E61_01292 [Syntrophorhabdus sp. PtaB.Bin184]
MPVFADSGYRLPDERKERMSIVLTISEDEHITIDTFQPGDAAGVGDLFRKVYGEEYPVRLVYDPEGLVRAFEKHENIPAVARSSKGIVVGYVSIFRSAPVGTVYEAGQGLVLVDYRKHGILREMIRYYSEVLAPAYGADAVFGEAVCNHIYSQKAWAAHGAIETAIEVDLMPAEVHAREGATGRVSTLHMTRMYRPMEHTAYAPRQYEETMRFIYDGLTSGARVEKATDGFAGVGPTSIESNHFTFAHVTRMTVRQAGQDFPAVFEEYERDALQKNMVVIQVWLKLSWPFIAGLTDWLRGKGYFFGGILPRWFGEDGLLMQKVVVRPNWEGIMLYSDRARHILTAVREDWQRATV